jgi:hypothetical protein
VLLTRENLEQLSEEEIETIYQENQADYEQRIKKNKRIQDLLSKKVDEREKSIRKLNVKISRLLEKNPDIKMHRDSRTGMLK